MLFLWLYDAFGRSNEGVGGGFSFRPGLMSTLGGCSGRGFVASLVTNVVIKVMTLPLTVTFNVTSKMDPRGKLVATVLNKFFMSLLKKYGMRVNKPANTFVMVMCNVVRGFKVRKLTVTAIITNVVLMVVKTLGLKAIVGFVPCPVIINFADNVTLAVFAARVGSLFKLAVSGIPTSFVSG